MFNKANQVQNEEKKQGVVAKIKEVVKEYQANNPNATTEELKTVVLEKYADINESTLTTQISKILREQDPELPFKQAIKGLVKSGNLNLTETDRIQIMIDIYKSSMTVEDVVAYLSTKKSATLKLSDLINYNIVDESVVGAIEIKFNNRSIFVIKA